MYNAKILADSIAPNGVRLTTFEVTYPLIVHNELMTHRDFSRNAASSRAIPARKMVERVIQDPFIPDSFPMNQKGMQPAEFYNPNSDEGKAALIVWKQGTQAAVECTRKLVGLDPVVIAPCPELPNGFSGTLNVHKEVANRKLASDLWITVVCSATRFSNFFSLRCHPMAQRQIRHIAEMMKDLYDASDPRVFDYSETYPQWHLPYITQGERELASGSAYPDYVAQLQKMSVARCARVSYMTHATDDQPERKSDVAEDIALADRLSSSGHWSPFEHVATPAAKSDHVSGNFFGWIQYRKSFAGECR